MKKVKLKNEVVYSIYAILIILLISMLYYADFSNKKLNKNKEDYTYVSKLFDTGVKSVVSTPTIPVLNKPYNNEAVKVVKSFYNYKGEEKEQQNSIINYETTYMQNTGVIYGGVNEPFDVVSVLDGKVTSVKEDNLLGKIITIEHENNIITTYTGLSEVTIREGDEVTQGLLIGKSGESNLEKELGNHLQFDIKINNEYKNPEECFGKQISELAQN